MIPDLYRPTILLDSPSRVQVLLRRAHEHRQSIDEKILQLSPSGSQEQVTQWMKEHNGFMHDKKLRMELCLNQLECYLLRHPDATVKAEIEML